MAKRINYFLPFVRQGITILADHSAKAGKRMSLPVKLTVQASNIKNNESKQEMVEKDIFLFGPGDLLGINENVISRITPPSNVDNYVPNLIPSIEFSEPDFLWRFSSLQTSDKKNWIPWLSLIILKSEDSEEEGEFVKIQSSQKGLPPQIQLKSNAILPDLKESWRWAHVHTLAIEDSSPEQIANTIKNSAGRTICRLMSPRKLKPQTRYHAFLVPTFKIGAEAAMGITDGVHDRNILTWATPQEGTGKVVPYYYEWEFNTGIQRDFENLVRKLKPQEISDMGTRPIDCSNPGYGLNEDGLVMQMEAALKSVKTQYQSWGMDNTNTGDTADKKKQKALADVLNKREESVGDTVKLRVTPPVYGEWYAKVEDKTVKVDATNREHWVEELNLDFRHRAAAGLGVQFVKENQETLMKSAWEQLSKVKKVNQELNLGRFGREVSACIHKRLSKMNKDNLYKIALPIQNKIAYKPEQTINSYIKKGTEITNNLTRPKIKKYITPKKVANIAPGFINVNTDQLVSKAFRVQGMKNLSPTMNISSFSTSITAPTQEVNWVKNVVEKTIAAINPKTTIEKKINSRILSFRNIEKASIAPDVSDDKLHPITWYPEFHRPMYRFLRDLSIEHIAPGIENISQNSVGLLETNRRFIEAFMVGLNHEMASELRWREFPTDMKGSYFRSFWDTSIYSVDPNEKILFGKTDIAAKLIDNLSKKYGDEFNATIEEIEKAYDALDPTNIQKEVADAYEAAIEKWLLTRNEDKDLRKIINWAHNSRLGSHPINSQSDQNQIVILIRGELLQKFNNTIIYLVKRKQGNPNRPDLNLNSDRTFPIFEGEIPSDIVFLGFNITADMAEDYFIVFEERMTEMRLGLDETKPGSLLNPTENDFSWEHFETLPQEGYLDGIQPSILTKNWNNAAYIARVMMQKQVRAAIELKRLLPDNN